MKKSPLIIYLIPLLVLVSIGCKKEVIPPVNIPPDCTSPTLGDTLCFEVMNLELEIEGSYNHPASDSFDIDADGDYDIQFRCNSPGSPGSGIQKIAQIRCLSAGTQIAVISVPDTSYLNVRNDTIDDSPPAIIHVITRGCERLTSSDSIVSSGTRFLLDTTVNQGSDLLGISNWQVATLNFAGSLYGFIPSLVSMTNDTAYYVQNLVYNDCHNLPDGRIYNLAIRTLDNDNNSVRYGWIKFLIHDEIVFSISQIGLQAE